MDGQKWPFGWPFLAAHLPTVLPLTSASAPTHLHWNLRSALACTFDPLYRCPFLDPPPAFQISESSRVPKMRPLRIVSFKYGRDSFLLFSRFIQSRLLSNEVLIDPCFENHLFYQHFDSASGPSAIRACSYCRDHRRFSSWPADLVKRIARYLATATILREKAPKTADPILI